MSKAETSAIIKAIARTAVYMVAKPVSENTSDFMDDIDDIIEDIPDDPENNESDPPADNPDAEEE